MAAPEQAVTSDINPAFKLLKPISRAKYVAMVTSTSRKMSEAFMALWEIPDPKTPRPPLAEDEIIPTMERYFKAMQGYALLHMCYPLDAQDGIVETKVYARFFNLRKEGVVGLSRFCDEVLGSDSVKGNPTYEPIWQRYKQIVSAASTAQPSL